MPKRLSRRAFLAMTGAAITAAGAGQVWIPRRALASPAASRASRLLILHAGGGARTTCLFNANVATRWNPFGVVSANDVDATGVPVLAAGARWGVGRALLGLGSGESTSTLTPRVLSTWNGATLPYVSQIADRISVLGAVDHDPTQAQGDGNHVSATRRMCTGAPDGRVGFLTSLWKELLSRQQDRCCAFPPVIVGGSGPAGASVYGIADHANARYRPILLNGPADFKDPPPSPGTADPDWVTSLESQLDNDFVQARPSALDGRAAEHIVEKELGLQYGATLGSDALRIAYADATLGTLTNGTPLSNAMLAELFGLGAQPDVDTSDADPWAAPTALGVRLLQSGAPAVAIGVGGWDLHSGEGVGLPTLAGSLGRALSALYFVLSQLKDEGESGRSWWDTTLVVFTSEFSRDNTADTSAEGRAIGFNAGDGSDHHGTAPCRYQALPIMGGGIPGGRLIAPTDEDVNPIGLPIASPSVLALMMLAMDVEPSSYFGTPPLTDVWG